MDAYLDTSALVKRYIKEEGSDEIWKIFEEAYSSKSKVCFSFFNIPEALGVFDKYTRRGQITLDEFRTIIDNFFSEILTLYKLNRLRIGLINSSLLLATIPLILKYHIYVADAMQIVTFKNLMCDAFYTSDTALYNIANQMGIRAIRLP